MMADLTNLTGAWDARLDPHVQPEGGGDADATSAGDPLGGAAVDDTAELAKYAALIRLGGHSSGFTDDTGDAAASGAPIVSGAEAEEGAFGELAPDGDPPFAETATLVDRGLVL